MVMVMKPGMETTRVMGRNGSMSGVIKIKLVSIHLEKLQNSIARTKG